jgi:hypothetical protein
MKKIEEKKNKTVNAMTLRLEKVIFWKKYRPFSNYYLQTIYQIFLPVVKVI